MFFYHFLTFLCFFSALSADIFNVHNLEEVNSHFQTYGLNSETLVLWDVDATLIIPKDQILQPAGEEKLKDLRELYLQGRTKEDIYNLHSKILSKLSYILVDPFSPVLIENLQKNSIPTMAFTAMKTGSYGIIEDMVEWRINQLKILRIDFSLFLPHIPLLSLSLDSRTPAFKNGILCSDWLAKGPVLSSFLEEIGWKPSRIYFIDDNLSFLLSVEEAMKQSNIPFHGLHYRAIDQLHSTIDETIVHHQFKKLAEEEIWLSDEEAKNSLKACL